MNNLQAIRKFKKQSQKEVADALDIAVPTYSKIETGKIQLTVERLLKLSSIFSMPADEIICFDQSQKKKNSDKSRSGNITYLPMWRQEMWLDSSLDENVHEENSINFYLPIFSGMNFYMIRAEKDSMYPTLWPGDFILIRRTSLEETLRWGDIYLIVTTNEVLIKRLFKKEKSLFVKSDYIGYEYEIDSSLIKSLWEIHGVISKNLVPRIAKQEIK